MNKRIKKKMNIDKFGYKKYINVISHRNSIKIRKFIDNYKKNHENLNKPICHVMLSKNKKHIISIKIYNNTNLYR